MKKYNSQSGLTYIELLVTVAILMVLSMLVLPVAKFSIQRQKEIELRRDLRTLRDAIDAYHEAAAPTQPGQTPKIQIKFGTDGWPPDLKSLVEGQAIIGDASGKKIRFLRRIPIDPMTNTTEWGLRSTQDDADSTSWGGENVWDVHTKSQQMSLDGVTHYNEW
jgi:general secretion pathway protein G